MVALNPQRSDLAGILKPGSMGPSMPGFRVVVVDPDGHELSPGETGELAIDIPRSPLYWFRGYWREPDWTARRFLNNGCLYLTGERQRKTPTTTCSSPRGPTTYHQRWLPHWSI